MLTNLNAPAQRLAVGGSGEFQDKFRLRQNRRSNKTFRINGLAYFSVH